MKLEIFHIKVSNVSDKIHIFDMHGIGPEDTGMKAEKRRKKRKKARAPVSCFPGARPQGEESCRLRYVMLAHYQPYVGKSCGATESSNKTRDLEVSITKNLSYTKPDL